jgi:hypothetical protein
VRLVEALGKEQETLGSFSQKPSSRDPGSGRDEMLRYIQAASSEWDMDLASIEVVRTEGDISPAEAAARRRARGSIRGPRAWRGPTRTWPSPGARALQPRRLPALPRA